MVKFLLTGQISLIKQSHTYRYGIVKQGSYPLSEAIFQDFFRTQIHFSRAPKCTVIEAIDPHEIEIQK